MVTAPLNSCFFWDRFVLGLLCFLICINQLLAAAAADDDDDSGNYDYKDDDYDD